MSMLEIYWVNLLVSLYNLVVDNIARNVFLSSSFPNSSQPAFFHYFFFTFLPVLYCCSLRREFRANAFFP